MQFGMKEKYYWKRKKEKMKDDFELKKKRKENVIDKNTNNTKEG